MTGAALGAGLGLWGAGAERAGAAVNVYAAPALGQEVCRGSHFLLTPAPLYRGGGLLQLQELKSVCERQR